MQLRPLTPDDAAALLELRQAAEAVDVTGENYDLADVQHDLADPTLDLVADTRVGVDGHRILGVVQLRVHGTVAEAEGVVHPAQRRRGHGGTLVDWARARTRAQGATTLHLQGPDTDSGLAALCGARSGVPVRHYYDMQCDLGTAVPPAPGALVVQPVGDPPPHEELRLAHVEAFAEHWGSVPPSPERWAQWFTGSPAFRTGLSFVSRDRGGRLLGYALGYEWVADTAATGVREAWLGQLGVLPAARGAGVGSALLAAFLGTAATLGHGRAGLGVDTANATGALGLYERAGFTVVRRGTTYALPLR